MMHPNYKDVPYLDFSAPPLRQGDAAADTRDLELARLIRLANSPTADAVTAQRASVRLASHPYHHDWMRWKAEHDPPGMQLHHLTDLEGEPWVVQVFDTAAEHVGPGGINGYATEGDARRAAWDWHDERHALQPELDELRRLWSTTPGIHFTEGDDEDLRWPEALAWSLPDVAAIKAWLASGASTAPPPGPLSRRRDADEDVIRMRLHEIRSRITPGRSYVVRLLLPRTATEIDLLAVAEHAAGEKNADRIIVQHEPGEPAPTFAVRNDGGVWRWGTASQIADGHGMAVLAEGREDNRTDGEGLAIDATWEAWVRAGRPEDDDAEVEADA